MPKKQQQYLIDDKGRPVAVLVKIAEYRRLLRAAEELESIRAYDEAKSSNDEVVPLEDALTEIERRSA